MTTVNFINLSLETWGCVISTIVAICLLISHHSKDKSTKLYFSILIFNTGALFFDILALFFRGKSDPISWWGVRLSNFTAFSCNYLLMGSFGWYLTTYLEKKIKINRLPLYFIWFLTAICEGLVIATQFYPIIYHIDNFNVYHRDSFFYLSHVIAILTMICCAYMLLKYRKSLDLQVKIAFWIYLVLPIIALTIQLYSYGVVFLGMVNTISIVLVFLFIQEEQGKKMAEQQNEITQNRIAIMLSQIQPHFLYNALNTIQYLCETDPKTASHAIESFSKYLRANMDSLTQIRPIPLKQDLEHLNNYLAIEKLRYPNIKIVYDLKSSNFRVPALTLQPLVENAFKHGLRKLENGGVINISTYQSENSYYIIIKDNGCGFDLKAKNKNDNRSHVGIECARSRLNSMCNGTLDIDSVLNKGTTITITIPKGDTL